jgi:hypothetical protein
VGLCTLRVGLRPLRDVPRAGLALRGAVRGGLVLQQPRAVLVAPGVRRGAVALGRGPGGEHLQVRLRGGLAAAVATSADAKTARALGTQGPRGREQARRPSYHEQPHHGEEVEEEEKKNKGGKKKRKRE